MRMGRLNVKEEFMLQETGLSREEMKRIRKELTVDEDYGKVGREICYSEEAMAKIRQIIKKTAAPGVKLGDLAPMKVTGGEEEPDAATVILDGVVTKIYEHNPQYMEVLLGGQTVTVRVNSNVNFMPGMIIQSRQLAMRNPRVFDFIGRCPRAKGKW